MKAVTAHEMRAIEARSVDAGVSLDALMEKAGLAVANAVAARLDRVFGSIITVLVGPGNNGSDGLVAARHLATRGARVKAFVLTRRPDPDEKRVAAEDAGVEFLPSPATDRDMDHILDTVTRSDVVIDAILGTGRARPLAPPLAEILPAIRRRAEFVVAVDLPTGMDADTGQFDDRGLPADLTLMLGFPKIGPLLTAGDGQCGAIKVQDIGIPEGLADGINTEWITHELAARMLPERPGQANKGTFGRTLVTGGSRNYLGAPLLATRAALRSGTGLVFLAMAEPVQNLIAGQVQEAIYLPLPAEPAGGLVRNEAAKQLIADASGMDAILIGPGLGQEPATVQFVEQLIRSLPRNIPTVLDADALNILARIPDRTGLDTQRDAPLLLTPHPGEMARLLGCSVQDVQRDRASAAKEAASRFNACVVLKGAATVIADATGAVRVSPWVNTGLAKGGTGDVLAGLVAGLLAQLPYNPMDAASLAVFVHGLAGDIVRRKTGERGMVAGDVVDAIPTAFMQLESLETGRCS